MTSKIIPCLIGVSGGPCSGKSTVCQKIVKDLQCTAGVESASRVAVIPMENFYKPKTTEQRDMALRGTYNLDHPDAFDEKLLLQTLKDLLSGRTVKVERHRDETPSFVEQTTRLDRSL
jgi:uridine kinase